MLDAAAGNGNLRCWRERAERALLRGMTEPTQEQVEQLTRAFERFTRRFKVAEAAAAADNALNALDAQTLVYVDDHPGCGMGDVARYLNVAMTTMSSAIDRLVKKAFVERRRPEGQSPSGGAHRHRQGAGDRRRARRRLSRGVPHDVAFPRSQGTNRADPAY